MPISWFDLDAHAAGLTGDATGDAPGGAPAHTLAANMAGDYSYMSRAYYASLDAELHPEHGAGACCLPSPAEALDAYVVPIALAKAERAGLATPRTELVTDRFPPPPFLAYPVNPFRSKGELILDAETLQARRAGLTYTGKYAVLCQLLPEDSRVDVVRVVLGRTLVPEFGEFAAAVFRVFRIPLMRVRVVVASRAYLLSAITPLPLEELSAAERDLTEGLGAWRS